MRPLYLAWLAAYGTWERDEDAFDQDEDDELEPPIPAGLCSLTAPQRTLADFLRLDSTLLQVAAQSSPPLADTKDDPGRLAKWMEELPPKEGKALLLRVVQGQGHQVQTELLRRFRGEPDPARDDRPRRTVAELLDTAAALRHEREREAEAGRAAQAARREQQRAAAREYRPDALTGRR
ncbi:hypothetical protein [Actinomadura sp. GTD37]|uniref:hypothetical protein n=1 Tax=Actinomadura sp. GTD37 TaxID=1778030 RepID=UPI0035C07473